MGCISGGDCRGIKRESPPDFLLQLFNFTRPAKSIEEIAAGGFEGARGADPRSRCDERAGPGAKRHRPSSSSPTRAMRHGDRASGHPAYSASKGEVRIYTKSAAVRHSPLGIRVNSVHPGYMPPMLNATNANERADKIALTPPI
jgi:NAD(P)-dependent dehydrogenase (short-subunit alcohol dehydrogenase family)